MSAIKRLLKAYAPPSVLALGQAVHKRAVESSVKRYDYLHFRRFRFRTVKGASMAQLDGKLIFHAHSIEKGLSRSNLRLNFGEKALQELAKSIGEYRRLGYPTSRTAYVNAISTLKAYRSVHEDVGERPLRLYEIFDSSTLGEIESCESQLGGATVIKGSHHGRRLGATFSEVFESRVSVREFAHTEVAEEQLASAIQLAMKSPSVCNRQSARVTVVRDPELVSGVLELQGGMSGYALPPVLLVITVDVSSFLEPTERNQPFVDGGLFAMSLLLSLENSGLAACPLNAMMSGAKEDTIKSMLSLPKSERLIMFAAVGHFVEEVKVPKSFRYRAEEITTFI